MCNDCVFDEIKWCQMQSGSELLYNKILFRVAMVRGKLGKKSFSRLGKGQGILHEAGRILILV